MNHPALFKRFAAGLVLTGVAVACSSTENLPGTTQPALDSTAPTDSATPPADSAAAADAAPFVVPAGCTEIQLGTLRGAMQLTPNNWDRQPRVLGNPTADLVGRSVLPPPMADGGTAADAGAAPDAGPALAAPDDFALFLRAPVAAPNGLPVDLKVGGADLNFATCATCARLIVDNGVANNIFMAESGNFHLTAMVNDHQFAGTLENVVLREVTLETVNGPIKATRALANGACYYVRSTTVDARVAAACDPTKAATSCGAGKTCIATNIGGTDGVCVASNATLADGAECTPADNGDSDCAVGSVCNSSRFTPDRTERCMKRCNITDTVSGCPVGRFCSGFGQCELPESVVDGPLLQTVEIDQVCTAAQNEYLCGHDGALGICKDVDGEGPGPIVCRALATQRAQCLKRSTPDQLWEMGYFGFPKDYSLGFCYPRPPMSF